MTSLRQWRANRRNAVFSTGPRTLNGKLKSRENAVRHGLTAETVIGVLEDPEEYRVFEDRLLADYSPETEIGGSLVCRLASLMWRLRRATIIETSLLEIQAEIQRERQLTEASGCEQENEQASAPVESDPQAPTLRTISLPRQSAQTIGAEYRSQPTPDSQRRTGPELARCFLRLIHLESRVLDRLSRYEANLWRQTVQTILALEALGDRQ